MGLWKRERTDLWCCSIFKSWFENGGMRGASYVVVRNEVTGGPSFAVIHRALDQGAPFDYIGDEPVATVTDFRISYCPHCGKLLEKWYAKTWERLIREDVEVP